MRMKWIENNNIYRRVCQAFQFSVTNADNLLYKCRLTMRKANCHSHFNHFWAFDEVDLGKIILCKSRA